MRKKPHSHWLTNFGIDEDYSKHLIVAEFLGLEAYIDRPFFEHRDADYPIMKGFYLKCDDFAVMKKFWKLVENDINFN